MADSYGDTCTTWYDDNPTTCGQYDSATFISTTACCACGGGVNPSDSETVDLYIECLMDIGMNETAEKHKCDSMEFEYDEFKYRFKCWPSDCQNDDTVADPWGDTCTAYYDGSPEGCSNYDSDTFISGEACCACGGGIKSTEDVPFAGYICQDDNSVGDQYGDTCATFYDVNPEQCGNYDTDIFVASQLCCACGANPAPVAVGEQVLEDDDYYSDSEGNVCSGLYRNRPQKCGLYDTDKFKASEMCVGCGGGIPELGTYCDQTRAKLAL